MNAGTRRHFRDGPHRIAVRGLIWLMLLEGSANHLQAADFYVATSGNDAGDGKTPQTAFKSLAAACRRVPAGENTIHIAPGVYEEAERSVVPAGVSLAGAGIGKTVFAWKVTHRLEQNPMAFDFNSFMIQVKDSSDASISGFTINGEVGEDRRAHGGIIARDVRGFLVHDCQFLGLEFCGVWLTSATNSGVNECRFEDCGHPDKVCCSGALLVGPLTDCEIGGNVIREHRGAYGIKTWRPIWTNPTDWGFLWNNKVSLVRTKFHSNDIDLRQHGAWGDGQPNMDLELWCCDPVECEIYSNRFYECVSLVGGADAPKTIRVHHNLWRMDPGYNYAIEADSAGLEIDHNYFQNGAGTISSFGEAVRNLSIHDNTFDGVMDINVLGFPGLTGFRFVNNTVVVEKDMPLLGLGKHSGISSNLVIANNRFVKKGGEPLKGPLIQFKEGEAPSNVIVAENAFCNWNPSGDQATVLADPGPAIHPEARIKHCAGRF